MSESTTRSLVNRLYQNRLMKSQAETDQFIAAMRLLEEGQTPIRPVSGLLPFLLRVFDDQCEMHEVMFDLIHYVERYDMDDYLAELTSATPEQTSTALGWLGELYLRVLNHEWYRDALIGMLPSLPFESLRAIQQVMAQIREDYGNHAEAQHVEAKIAELLSS